MGVERWEEATPVTNTMPVVPLSHAERARIFGSFAWAANPTVDNPERISLTGDWVARNIITVPTPQLMHLHVNTVRFHRLAVKQFLGLLNAWGSAGLIHHIETWDGAFVPRLKRGHAGSSLATDLSNHSWGTAFDVNAQWNRLGVKPAPLGQRGCVRELVSVAREFGFFWGGDFKRPDGMHFEVCKLLP